MKLPRYVHIGYEGPRWVAYYYLIGLANWSLGFHVHLAQPFNVELHLPGGFIRIGRQDVRSRTWHDGRHRFGVWEFGK